MRAPKHAGRARVPRGTGVATVTSAAESLWPPPAANVVGWRPWGGRASGPRDVTYTVVPTLRSPRYLVPSAPQAAVALRPVQGGVKGMRMRVLSLLQGSSVLSLVPGRRLHVLRGPVADGIEDLLGSVVDDVAHVVVRLGRPRPNRTLVVWAIDADGTPVAIAKVSRGDAARRAMETEYLALGRSPAAGVPGLIAPGVLGYVHWHDNDVLVISALVRSTARPSHVAPVRQMRALAASVGVSDLPLLETAWAGRLAEDIQRLGPASDGAWLRHSLEALLDDVGGTMVRTGAWHGDWVSWNQSSDDEGVLLWDWEHYTTSGLAGFDHVHFLAQERRAQGTDTAAEDAWLAEADVALATDWGMEEDRRRAVLRGYLLEVNVRFLRDRQYEDGAPTRVGWGRGLIERMARTSPA